MRETNNQRKPKNTSGLRERKKEREKVEHMGQMGQGESFFIRERRGDTPHVCMRKGVLVCEQTGESPWPE